MKTITVTASKTYDILVGNGLLDDAGRLLKGIIKGQAAAIISDDNVAPLYAQRLTNSLAASGFDVTRYVFPHGEASKNGDTFMQILGFLAQSGLTRADAVIALGGGVVGDLAGFAAACYMRGVGFVQIPTTLLAAVDSSVGGKTAIDLPAGKNLAGAFYQPDAVICDIALLSTLSETVYRDGCAEVIKTGVLGDRALFESLATPIRQQEERVIARCIQIKRDIVAQDEYETGVRKLLNLGHTAGHAIELLSKFEVTHGHAVAVGMAIVARAAAHLGLCDSQCADDIINMLSLYGLPTDTRFSAAQLAQACLADKKRQGQALTMIFPQAIGECVLRDVRVDELEGLFKQAMEAQKP